MFIYEGYGSWVDDKSKCFSLAHHIQNSLLIANTSQLPLLVGIIYTPLLKECEWSQS